MSKKYYQKGTKTKLGLSLVAIVCVIGMIFGLFGYIEKKNEKAVIQEQDELNRSIMKKDEISYDGKTYVKKQNVKSYLILGTDISNQAEVNKEFVENGLVSVMADSIYLVITDDEDKSYDVLQLDRNTITGVHMLDASGKDFLTTNAQLCTSFFYGSDYLTGSQNTALSVSEMLGGINIDGFATFTMDSIPVINSMVGGVNVILDQDLSHIDPEMIEGRKMTLNDEQAKIYVQNRMNVDDGTNASRLLRQSGYISALIEQAKELAKTNGSFVNEVYGRLNDVMYTNFSADNFAQLITVALSYDNNGIVTIDGETVEGTVLNDGLEHEEFYPDEKSLNEVVLHLYYREK